MTTYAAYDTNKIQFGRESTPGTAVNATTIYRGAFSHIQDTSPRTVVEEQVGLLVPGERSYQASLGGMLALPATPMTFEQVLHWFEAGIETVSPSGSGDYTYEYAYPVGTTLNAIKTYSVQSGNALASADNRRLKYAFVESMTFAGKAGEAWTMEGSWKGHQPTATALTSGLSLVSVEEALVPKTSFYLDASGGTLGNTQKLGVFMGGQIAIKTGIMAVPVGDGSLNFAAIKYTKPVITFTVTVELEQNSGTSLVATERAIMEAGTARLFRLSIAGTSNRNITFDFAGVYDSFSDYENSNGNTTVTMSGHAVYSSADSLFFEASVTNKLAAVP